jgi:hypothetical protein
MLRRTSTPAVAVACKLLAEATGFEAQLALSYRVWPGEAPDPRVVDEWLDVCRMSNRSVAH